MGDNDKKFNTDVNDRVKHIRKQNHLTQFDFSQSIGIKQATLSDIERCRIGVSSKLLSRIVEKYKINVEWLLTGEEGVTLRETDKKIDFTYKAIDLWPHFSGEEEYDIKSIDSEMNSLIRRRLNFLQMYLTPIVFRLGLLFDPNGILESEIIKKADAFVKQFENVNSFERPKYELFSIEQKTRLIKEIDDAVANMGEATIKFIEVIDRIGLQGQYKTE